MNNFFRLYACCLLVKGAKRSMICDVQRTTFYLIPNGLYDILNTHKGKSIGEIKEIYEHQYDEVIDEYFGFLIANEYVFWCNKEDLELFPDLDLFWDAPAHATNAVVDVSENSNHDFKSIFEQFETLGCKHFQLRVFVTKPLSYFEDILQELENRRIISVEFIIEYSHETDFESLKMLVYKYPRVHNFIVHSANENKIYNDNSGMGNIVFVKQVVDDESHCGIISSDYFSINLKTFTESQKHNTCLNRKISIDADGNIKNCPSMVKNYGNLRDITLKEAIEKQGFKQMWTIHKDQIEICKDCEFRQVLCFWDSVKVLRFILK